MEKLEFIDSKFRLAILAAKRAKQLVGGSKKKIEAHAENHLTTALEEIRTGKIKFRLIEIPEEFINNPISDDADLVTNASAVKFLLGKSPILDLDDEKPKRRFSLDDDDLDLGDDDEIDHDIDDVDDDVDDIDAYVDDADDVDDDF